MLYTNLQLKESLQNNVNSFSLEGCKYNQNGCVNLKQKEQVSCKMILGCMA